MPIGVLRYQTRNNSGDFSVRSQFLPQQASWPSAASRLPMPRRVPGGEPELQSRPVSWVWPPAPSSLELRLKPMRLPALMAMPRQSRRTAMAMTMDTTPDRFIGSGVWCAIMTSRALFIAHVGSSEPMITAMTDPTMDRPITAAGNTPVRHRIKQKGGCHDRPFLRRFCHRCLLKCRQGHFALLQANDLRTGAALKAVPSQTLP